MSASLFCDFFTSLLLGYLFWDLVISRSGEGHHGRCAIESVATAQLCVSDWSMVPIYGDRTARKGHVRMRQAWKGFMAGKAI